MFLDNSCLVYNWVYLTNDEKFIFDQKTKQKKLIATNLILSFTTKRGINYLPPLDLNNLMIY